MIVSLAIAGAIVSLAAAAATGQLKFFRGVGEVSAVRGQVSQAALIAANVLRGVGSTADLHVALDSAVEVSVTIGSALACATDTGRLRVPGARLDGATLASFLEEPQAGDLAHAFIPDSASGWLRLTVAAPPVASGCPRFPESPGWQVPLAEPLVVPAGAPIRFTRRTRVSLYRSSDGGWYLGLKEWNGALDRFNTIQPAAGPLAPYGALAESGLHFQFLDSAGGVVPSPVDPARVALVTIRARGASVRPASVPGMTAVNQTFHADSTFLSVAIRRP